MCNKSYDKIIKINFYHFNYNLNKGKNMKKNFIFVFFLLFFFSLNSYSQDNTLVIQKLLDEMEIKRIVDDIDNTCDAKEWQKCRSYFSDEVEVDFSSLVGGGPCKIKSDDLISAWTRGLFPEKQSFHIRTNHQITISGEQAEVFSKGYALNILAIKNGSDLWEVWGNYIHKLKKTNDGWKVTAMKFTVVYARGNEKVREYLPENKK